MVEVLKKSVENLWDWEGETVSRKCVEAVTGWNVSRYKLQAVFSAEASQDLQRPLASSLVLLRIG